MAPNGDDAEEEWPQQRWPPDLVYPEVPSRAACWKGFRRLCAITPFISLSIVCLVTLSTLYFGWVNPTNLRHHSRIEMVAFCTEVALLMWSYLTAVLRGPGFVPSGWEPSKKEVRDLLATSDPRPFMEVEPVAKDLLQFCEICRCFKPPRAHHCKECGRCVLWMDHHCPWTGTCIGHDNMPAFVLFTHYVPLASLHAFVIHAEIPIRLGVLWYRNQASAFWHVLQRIHTVVGLTLAVVSLVVMILVGSLAFDLHWSLSNNLSMVEELVVDKAKARRYDSKEAQFVFPYDLGERENWKEVLGRSWRTWFLPLKFDGSAVWPTLREGSGAFDLSVETLVQKANKLSRGVAARTSKALTGVRGGVPAVIGFASAGGTVARLAAAPRRAVTDESSAEPDTWMLVTNREGGWVKAQRLRGGPAGTPEGPSGWLPECCFETLDEEHRYEVPYQNLLQGTWEVDPSDANGVGAGGAADGDKPSPSAPSAEPRRVRVQGPVARAAHSQLAFVLRPEEKSGVSLLGVPLLSVDSVEACWGNGEVWRRPPQPLPGAAGKDGKSNSVGGGALRQRRPIED
eukprot:CAMPEP_0177188560 /NCGR_PEP_ID=MMETSP0367-20130122/19793_1 /TAXON_ID=447022 ORGANISM="Scrippsiella hangoei-like, Strain SHHI-4" /NCGR_SAMPLE_ID=MMETSP0367 /ASSEMBLY_ACC=CAM_ASM_000362 /LENGTH=568 /DNA_ID=CAMNT_0018636025 /DNA_START=76 /DNA_END=1782 /DNA_ORIENTATION=+